MEEAEFRELVAALHAKGISDDQIMDMFYDELIKHKLCLSDFEIIARWMGYELLDGFYEDNDLVKEKR